MQALISDLALFAVFIVFLISVILFRRFHHQQNTINPDEIGPTAWGLYPHNREDELTPTAVTRQRPPRP